MSRWFRHYAGMMRDEKLVRAALKAKQTVERVVWVYGVILESAAEINDGGRYEIDHAELAYFLRADEDDIARIEDALCGLERVHERHVAKWSSRQFQSDRSAERTKRYRDRNKADSDGAINGSLNAKNVTMTSQEQSGDAPDTEIETDKKKELLSASPPRVSSAKFEEFWVARPRRKGDDPRAPAEKKFNAYVKSGIDPDAMIRGMKSHCQACRERDQYGTPFVPQTIKWLNDKRWLDYEEAAAEQQVVHVAKGFYAADGSEQLEAWDEYQRKRTGKGMPRDRNFGWRVESEWPPGYSIQQAAE